jgi:murein DD-endopeptidase MepM/ murein hydrolase activator NlpD
LKNTPLYITIVLLFLVACTPKPKEISIEKPIPKKVIEKKYGYVVNDLEILTDTIKNGQSFGEILNENNVSFSQIYHINEAIKDSFDVRGLRAGKPYTILCNDSLGEPEAFIYQQNKVDYVVVNLKDSVYVKKEKLKVTTKERELAGVITSSLSNALDEQGVSIMVGLNMSDIYAWSIDFFRLQKGDRFKVIYEEKFINDTVYAGMGKIKAAYFEHGKQPFYAFPFVADSTKNFNDYYDDSGKTLRKAFLKAPLKFSSRISSRYDLKRFIKFYGRVKPHRGTDFPAARGTPIIATANGTVVASTRRGGNGNFVKIRHNGTYSTQYLHMKKRKVKVGDVVKQGDVIGWVGMTGNTSGPHVCYRFWKNGKQVDPLREKLPEAKPMDSLLIPIYLKSIVAAKKQLDAIEYPQAQLDKLIEKPETEELIP